MTRTIRLLAAILLLGKVASAASIEYTVEIDTTDLSGISLGLSFTALEDNPVVKLPNWMPGAWMVADYARHLSEMQAEDALGTVLKVDKVAANRWLIECQQGREVRLQYRQNSSPRGFMGQKITSTGGTLFGAPTFIFVTGQLLQPLTIQFKVPSNWEIHTGLEPVATPGIGSSLFRATDYHQLIDSPFRLGLCDSRTFPAGNKLITVVLPTDGDFNRQDFQEMVAALVEEQTDFFGSSPFERFLFFIHYTRGTSGGGGLEHRNSTSIGLPLAQLQSDLRLTAPILAHELFHAWNMKQFFPLGFRNFEYELPLRTSAFWLGEGITDYYGWLLTLRSSVLLTEEEFLQKIAQEIAQLEETAARDTVSVAEASRSVWEQGYAGGGVDFYNKGFLVGWSLDFELRQTTAAAHTLDDYLRLLAERFGGTAGYSDNDLLLAMGELAGRDMTQFFASYIEGTIPLDYAAILRTAGLKLNLERNQIGWIGDLTLFGPEHRFYMIGNSTPLGRAGVQRGDALLAIGEWQLTGTPEATAVIEAMEPGSATYLVVERNGDVLQLPLVIASRDRVTADIYVDPNADNTRHRFRRQWLSGATTD
ncbi:MAG: M61 family metallopeptidase [Candidatus Delongbacteria bacterium]|nr:M61 family metallopeptidase [Candidatus Delongbacteria bacterium]